MPSLISTAIALPLSLTLVLLPPLLQIDARNVNSNPPTLASFVSAILDKTSYEPIASRVQNGVGRLLSYWFTFSLTNQQRATVLRFEEQFPGLFAACGLALLGLWATSLAIERTKETFKARGFKGRDLLKPQSQNEIPETMGLPAASVYILLLFLFIPFRYFSPSMGHPSVTSEQLNRGSYAPVGWEGKMDGMRGFPHHELASFLSALLSFLSAIILGFLDDVFDIRWRYKLPIPIVSSIPLLMVYYAGGGGTSVVVPGWPEPLRTWIGSSIVELGPLYYVYMSLLSTFCTNSINILAGINGVEVGQALVIAVSLAVNDLLYLDSRAGQPGSRSSEELLRRHLFSLYLLLPLIGVSLGLLVWNRYPSRVFVGDTFCYFAGMVFSTVGILGHFSKTVLLFFVPQIFNFIFSCPQLFGLVPNPRHRVPRCDVETNSLYPSITEFGESPIPDRTTKQVTNIKPLRPASRLTVLVLSIFEKLHLVQLDWYPSGKLKSTTNLTLLNAILVFRRVRHTPSSPRPFTGPKISEWQLWLHVMALQAAGSLFAFGVRYWIAAIVFPSH